MSRREKRAARRAKAKKISLAAVLIISAAVFLYAAISLAGYYKDHNDELQLEQQLAQLRNDSNEETAEAAHEYADASAQSVEAADTLKEERTPEQIRAFYQRMQEKNDDYTCWITIEGSAVDYPVLKRDNSFYLNHDFEGNKNRHGSIFMDETCEPGDDVLLIHGHHMKDGTMFGDLKRFKDSDFRKEHQDLMLEFEDGIQTYRIFAVAQIDLLDEMSFVYEMLPNTKQERKLYIEQLEDASFWYDDIIIEETDRIVLLSTCDYGSDDERLIVAAREVSVK